MRALAALGGACRAPSFLRCVRGDRGQAATGQAPPCSPLPRTPPRAPGPWGSRPGCFRPQVSPLVQLRGRSRHREPSPAMVPPRPPISILSVDTVYCHVSCSSSATNASQTTVASGIREGCTLCPPGWVGTRGWRWLPGPSKPLCGRNAPHADQVRGRLHTQGVRLPVR